MCVCRNVFVDVHISVYTRVYVYTYILAIICTNVRVFSEMSLYPFDQNSFLSEFDIITKAS